MGHWGLRGAPCLAILLALAGCSSGDEGGGPGPSTGGSAGSAAGASGAAGKAAGSAGAGGDSGKGGSAGSQGGSAGTAGGAAGGCQAASECVLPETINPAGCAEAACEAGKCMFRAKDKDGDGKRAKLCKDTSGEVSVEIGNDCDDTDPGRYPGAWDGPEGEGKPSACDGLDNDCSGTADDNVLSDGTSCACKPGAIAACSEDSSGKTIVWPLGEPKGECKAGSKTCVVDAVTGLGAWGPCTGAVPPSPEVCDEVDNDCDDKTDDQDEDAQAPLWYCDADNDDEVSPDAKPVKHCAPPPASDCGSNPNAKWSQALPKSDCDDSRADINKKSIEVCDGGPDDSDGKANDEDCDGKANEGCSCTENEQIDCGQMTDCNFVKGGAVCKDGKFQYDPRCDDFFLPEPFCPDSDGDGYCATVDLSKCDSYCPKGTNPEQGPVAPSTLRPRKECIDVGQEVFDCDDTKGSISPTSKELCGDDLDSNCNKDNDDGYNLGSPCATGNGKGACAKGGTVACGGPSSSTTVCDAQPGVGAKDCQFSPAPNSNSWDWDCSGEEQPFIGETSFTPCAMVGFVIDQNADLPIINPQDANAVKNSPYAAFLVEHWLPQGMPSVDNQESFCAYFSQQGCGMKFVMRASTCGPGELGLINGGCRQPCGLPAVRAICEWQAGACKPASNLGWTQQPIGCH